MNRKEFGRKAWRRIRLLYVDFERLFSLTWFNPFATIYLNLRLLPLSNALKFPIYVYGRPRFFSLYGKAVFENERIKPGIVHLNRRKFFAGSANNTGGPSEFNIYGTLVFRGRCQVGTDNKICVGEKGRLTLGEGVLISSGCNITAHQDVVIGDYAIISHRSQIMDSNYHYVANFEKMLVKPMTSPVYIGNYCWICNSVNIMCGSKIPDYVIVASGAFVNKDMTRDARECIIGGVPAKILSRGNRFVYCPDFFVEISRYFNEHPNSPYYTIIDAIDHGICNPK